MSDIGPHLHAYIAAMEAAESSTQSVDTATQALLVDGRVVPIVHWVLPGADATTPLLAGLDVVELQDWQGTPLARRNASGALVPVSIEAGNRLWNDQSSGETK